MALRMAVDHATFLTEYWRKRPLLLRNAIETDWFRVPPDELAGLACEPDIESRLVIQRSAVQWEVRHGPFDPEDFAHLPEHRWTLLVQDVDKFRPDVAELIDFFDFLPAWQIDDIMISYAADQGGVGPHSDAYDVFLIQGSGQRRWRLSQRTCDDRDLLPGLDLRILREFRTDEDWILDPGDVLYLPPQVAHWGTAVGECMTYSLGFRTPTQRDLAADWFQYVISLANDQPLGTLADATASGSGYLGADLIEAAREKVEALPRPMDPAFDDWVGRFLTEPKPQFHIDPPDTEWPVSALRRWLEEGRALLRHPWARLCWSQTDGDRVRLFFNGDSAVFDANQRAAIAVICSHRRLTASLFAEDSIDAAVPVLSTLVVVGILERDHGR